MQGTHWDPCPHRAPPPPVHYLQRAWQEQISRRFLSQVSGSGSELRAKRLDPALSAVINPSSPFNSVKCSHVCLCVPKGICCRLLRKSSFSPTLAFWFELFSSVKLLFSNGLVKCDSLRGGRGTVAATMAGNSGLSLDIPGLSKRWKDQQWAAIEENSRELSVCGLNCDWQIWHLPSQPPVPVGNPPLDKALSAANMSHANSTTCPYWAH